MYMLIKCKCIYICICFCRSICFCICKCICIWLCVWLCVCVCVCVWKCTCMRTCICLGLSTVVSCLLLHLFHICLYIHTHINVIVNRQGHHNIRNGIVWVQTSHSTCTVSLHVVELWTHQKIESLKKSPWRRKSNSNLLIHFKNFQNRLNCFPGEWYGTSNSRKFHAHVQEHKRSTPRCYHQLQYRTTFCASTTRWTHYKHRTLSSKATVTSMWPSNVLRVVVLLWALPTHRAAECVALNPTESAAKDGRCLYGKPRGEGEGRF